MGLWMPRGGNAMLAGPTRVGVAIQPKSEKGTIVMFFLRSAVV